MQRARLLLGLAAGQTLAPPRSAADLHGRDREAMWKRLQADPPDGHTRWSLSLMARETGISTAQLSRWWSAAGLQPHRVRTFKLSDDPQFEAKMHDVIAVYPKKDPDVVRLCFDEKPRMQALARDQRLPRHSHP